MIVRCNDGREEKIAMRSIERLSNGISRDVYGLWLQNVQRSPGAHTSLSLAAHTKHDCLSERY